MEQITIKPREIQHLGITIIFIPEPLRKPGAKQKFSFIVKDDEHATRYLNQVITNKRVVEESLTTKAVRLASLLKNRDLIAEPMSIDEIQKLYREFSRSEKKSPQFIIELIQGFPIYMYKATLVPYGTTGVWLNKSMAKANSIKKFLSDCVCCESCVHAPVSGCCGLHTCDTYLSKLDNTQKPKK